MACLPLMWEIVTATLHDYEDNEDVVPDEQKQCR